MLPQIFRHCQGADPGGRFLCYDYDGTGLILFCLLFLSQSEYFYFFHPDPSFLSALRPVHNLVPSLVIKRPVSKSSSGYHPSNHLSSKMAIGAVTGFHYSIFHSSVAIRNKKNSTTKYVQLQPFIDTEDRSRKQLREEIILGLFIGL